MARIALSAAGVLLALWLVFGFLIPAVFATLKFLFLVALAALGVVLLVTVAARFLAGD